MEMDSSFRFGTCHFGNLKREVSLTFLFQIRIIRKKQKGCPFGGFLYDRWLVKTNLDHKNGGKRIMLLISHRNSTLTGYDRILHLEPAKR